MKTYHSNVPEDSPLVIPAKEKLGDFFFMWASEKRQHLFSSSEQSQPTREVLFF